MLHLDLFSGIGGFALAAQWVWGKKHKVLAYCDNNEFCQKVIRKNIERGLLPDAPIHGDIRTLDYERIMALTKQQRLEKPRTQRTNISLRSGATRTSEKPQKEVVSDGGQEAGENTPVINLVTGGFPCQ